ncbi:PspC domain-containing protein [Pseudaeromonas paramecii]|uniref:Envelope stress response membrane protein PspC n=1 Tax=Pseudaeromonas paramecii TaxID=2138166 RepID=A0ABP8PUU0_9GAMM
MSNWYRDTRHGALGGVCAGLAHRLGMEIWLVRLLVVLAALFGLGGILVLLYLAAWLFLDPMPPVATAGPMGGTSSVSSVSQRFDELDKRLQRLEKWVTSSQYRVSRDIKRSR